MNCLLTKLENVIPNDNIVKMGYVTLLQNGTGYNILTIACNEALVNPCTITVIKGTGHLKGGGTGYADATDFGQSVTLSNTNLRQLFVTPDSNNVIEISHVDNINSLSIALDVDTGDGVRVRLNNLESLKQLTGLHYFETNKSSVSLNRLISFLSNSSLESLILSNTETYGSLSAFAAFNSLNTLRIDGCTRISGRLADIGSLIALTNIRLYGDQNIYGSIEDFVRAQRAAGRTTEDTGINFTWIKGTNLTFNRQPLSVADNPKLTWTASTMRLKNSTSYDVTVNA